MNLTASTNAFPELSGSNSRTNFLHLPILMLTLIAAGAHFYLSAQPEEELHFFFLLNGLGYLGLVIAFLLPGLMALHQSIRWVMIGYALLTIVLWFFLGSPSEGKLDPFDMMVKLVEITLVIVLFQDKKSETSGAR